MSMNEQPLRSVEKMHAITVHAIDHCLLDDLIEIRRLCHRLCHPELPVIRIAYGRVRTFQCWMESLTDAEVTVSHARDGFVGKGVMREHRIAVTVLMAAHPRPVRNAGLAGEIAVAELAGLADHDDTDVLTGEPVPA